MAIPLHCLKHFLLALSRLFISLSFTITRLNLIVEPEEAVVTVKAVEISTLLCVSIPVVSLLADMAVGKYKVVSHCLRAVWLLSTLSAIVSVCEKSLPLTNTTIHYTQLILVLPQYVLLGAFIAAAVLLGIDQIHILLWFSF